MSIKPGELVRLVQQADHPLGVRELLKQAGLNPGEQTDLKRVLRELVRDGKLEKDGKRYTTPSARRAPAAAGAAGRGERGARGRGAKDAARPGRRDDGPSRSGGAPARAGSGSGRGRTARDDSAPSGEVVEGILHTHPNGFGFVHPLVGDGENIFLPPDQVDRALDGDRVRVEVVEGRGGKTQGRLLDVTARIRERAVGTYRVEGRRAWVEPSDKGLRENILVPPTQLARPGDLVKVLLGIGSAVLERGEGLHGEVLGAIGRPGEPSGEVLSVAYAQGFSDEFPDEVMAEADRVAPTVPESDARAEGRRDLRELPLVTIDGADARDFDDAVYVERAGDGWRLVVAIADVSHYVREGNALDAEAQRRGTSVYLPDRVLPMLPERLSNGICSLRPDEDRLCMVADMRLDGGAKLVSSELYPAVMRSAARCTYEEVQAVLDGEDVPHRNAFRPLFESLLGVSRALNAMRRARGALDFDLPEYKVMLGEDGMPLRLDKRERKDSHRLIEECMLAANEAVARFFRDLELPSVYRYHGDPDEEKLEVFASLARAHGFELGGRKEISPHDLMHFLQKLEGHPEARVLNQLLLRSMMQAVYSAENVGHYGLGAEHYLHFTSPIRRYPDLLVHRLLKAHWARGGKVPSKAQRESEEARLEALATQSSERERAAVNVEREVISYYSALLVKDRVGEVFDGTVSSVAEFGVFVELGGVFVEGLVKAELFGFGGKFDQTLHALVFPDGRRVRVGDSLRVRLASVSVERRQIDLEPEETATRRGVVRRRDEDGASAPVPVVGEEEAPAFGGRRRRADVVVVNEKRGPSRTGGGKSSQAETERGPFRGVGRKTGQRDDERGPARGGARSTRPEPPSPSPSRAPAPRTPREDFEHEQEPPRSESPHPGFDRLRALAAKKSGGGGSVRGGGKYGDSRAGGRSSRSAGEPEVLRDKFGNPRKPSGGGGRGGAKKGGPGGRSGPKKGRGKQR